jgi:hypothetical protein
VVDLDKIIRNPSAKHGGIFCLRQWVVILLLASCSFSYSQAKLVITDAKKNFGFVKKGTLVKNEFEISNTGTAPLLLTGTDIACSCTTVDYSKSPVLPGQKTTVVVNFNTTTVYGRQDRIVYLLSNDPAGPHKLRYKGIVSKE